MPTVYSGNASNIAIPQIQTITGATNATPIVVTTAGNHLYNSGDPVVVTNVNGNTAANSPPNSPWTITVLTPTTFSLNGSSGNGVYSSGGLALNLALNPPITLPLDGETDNAAAWNVALEGLADRAAFLASVLPTYAVVNTYLANIADDTWTEWAGSSSLGGTTWTEFTLGASPVGDLYNFPANIFGAIPRCNNGDLLLTAWELGVFVNFSSSGIAVSLAVQISSVAENAFVQCPGNAKLTGGPSTQPVTGSTTTYVDAGLFSGISITALSAGAVTITGLTGMSPQSVGDSITITGAASPGNNGTFPVSQYLSPTSVKATNPNGVAGDANNGAGIGYSMSNMKFNFQLQLYNRSGTPGAWEALGHRSMNTIHLRPSFGPPNIIKLP